MPREFQESQEGGDRSDSKVCLDVLECQECADQQDKKVPEVKILKMENQVVQHLMVALEDLVIKDRKVLPVSLACLE